MDIIGGWDSIDFNWSNNAMFVMYGCRTSYASDDSGQGFASKLSLLDNFKDVNVWGQTESTYPSYFPDIRTTSIMRSINIGWSFSPTYMVASSEGQGWDALFPDDKNPLKSLPMQCYNNGKLILTCDQSSFNDHRNAGRINQMISIILRSLILLFMIIVYPDYNKNLPAFEVYGENDILKDMVINMKTYSNHSKKNSSPTTIVQTILFKGNIQQVFESNDMGAASFFFLIITRLKRW